MQIANNGLFIYMELYCEDIDRYCMVEDHRGCPECCFFSVCEPKDTERGEVCGLRCWKGYVWRQLFLFQPQTNNEIKPI